MFKKSNCSIYKHVLSILFCIQFLDSFYCFCEEKKINECSNKSDNVDANASSVYQSTVDGINYVTNFCYHNPVYAVLGAVAICGGFVGLYYAFTSVGLAKSTALGVGSATLGSTTSSTSAPIMNEKVISSIGETIGEKIITKAAENNNTVEGLVLHEQSIMVDICKCLADNAEKLLSVDSPQSPLVAVSKALEASVSAVTDLVLYNPELASALLKVTKFVVDNPSLLYSVGFLSASSVLSTSKLSSTTNLRIAHFIRDRAINPSFFKDVDSKDHTIVLKDFIGIKTEEANKVVVEVVNDLVSKVEETKVVGEVLNELVSQVETNIIANEVVDELVSRIEINKVVGEVVDDLVNKVVEKNTSPTMNVANNTLYLVNLQVPAIDIVGGSSETEFRKREINEICKNICLTKANKIYFKTPFRENLINHYKSDPDFYKDFIDCVNNVDLNAPDNKNYFGYYTNKEITKQHIIIFARLTFSLSCATGPHLNLIPERLRNVMFEDVGDINAFKEIYDSEYDPFLKYLKENPTKIFSNKSTK